MTLLAALGLVSFAFVVAFTARAYKDDAQGNGQSRRSAIIEAWVNILIGFAINYAMNFILLPLVGARVTAMDNFMLGWVYTAISIVRQYTIRRWFNARIVALARRLGDAGAQHRGNT